MRAARALALAGAAAALAGCSFAPPYEPPAVAAASAYREAGPWTPADPAADRPRGAWWKMFGDPVLDDLEARAERANPDLAAAVAAYDQARAIAAQARTGFFPLVDVDLSRARTSPPGGGANYTDVELSGGFAYEVDLWGRVRNQAAAAGARAAASGADLQSVRLSLQALLADQYLTLRALEAQQRLLEDTVAAYARALDLTERLRAGGAASGLDLGRAQTQLANARAQALEVAAQRALTEHAVAVLVGEGASTFAVAPAAAELAQPVIPVAAPSVLLQRRPDIVAAERRVAAANAEIGVARAAWFPSLGIGGSGGWRTAGGVDLIAAPNRFWTLGPDLAGPLIDGGGRRAGVRLARARFEAAGADYRATVLDAFRQVEDQLTLANRLAEQATDREAAAAAAARTEELALIRYREGASGFLDVVTAQTAALDARRAVIALEARRLQAAVDLVRALGGGWDPQASLRQAP